MTTPQIPPVYGIESIQVCEQYLCFGHVHPEVQCADQIRRYNLSSYETKCPWCAILKPDTKGQSVYPPQKSKQCSLLDRHHRQYTYREQKNTEGGGQNVVRNERLKLDFILQK